MSTDYVLKLDGSPHGSFRARVFTEQIEVRLLGRGALRFDKETFWGNRLTLTDPLSGNVVAEAERSGTFTSAWDLRVSTGPARLVSAGVFNTGFLVERGGRTIAEVKATGVCNGSWHVRSADGLAATDLLFIGLTYASILRRNAAVVAAAG